MGEGRREASIIAGFAMLLATAAATPVIAVDDLSLNVVPGSESVVRGDTVTVTLDAANLSAAINGVQAMIHYDDTVLSLVDIAPTDLMLPPPAEGWYEVSLSDDFGDVTYAVVINGDSTINDGTIATLTFDVIGEGVTSLTFRPDVDPWFTKLTVAADNSTILPVKIDSGTIVSSAAHVAGLEIFYAGRFRFCVGGDRDGLACVDDAGCTGTPPTLDGTCGAPQPDASRSFLAAGAALFCVGGGNDGLGCVSDADCAVCVGGVNDGQPCNSAGDCSGGSCPRGTCASSNLDNITNYARGITGIRVFFDSIVDFATTADAAFRFQWTTGTGKIFSAVDNAGTAITVTPTVQGGVTVVDIVLADNHVRQRWLQVTIDSTQVSFGGVALDGELFGNPVVLPSGDAMPGGDAVFYLGNMSGEVSGDRKTRLFDVGQIRLEVNPAFQVPIENVYDVDKSGKVQLADVGLARLDLNPAFALPLISP